MSVHPGLFGEDSSILMHIFGDGCFNHQTRDDDTERPGL